MNIKLTESKDKEFWMSIDKHINEEGYKNRVYTKTGYVMWNEEIPVGLLCYYPLWENTPFLNFLFVKEEYRKNGFAKEAMNQWEEEMKKQGFKMTLISTQVDETAQFFYRKLGYLDCGGLVLNDTPLDQPMEMFMRKVL
ncbi:MAG: GNAT family N-acetyltransferase [Clostridium sp.]|nr:GNAT family N-acetyltransferase [Clostridium sp.]